MNENIKRLKGAKDLVFDAVEETTNLVERMHSLAAKKSTQPLAMIEPLATLIRGVKTVHDSIASGVYEMIRIVNRGVENLLDAGSGLVANGLACPDNLLPENKNAPISTLGNTCEPSGGVSGQDLIIAQSEAIINGLYGDYLDKKESALDLGLCSRHQGKILPMEKDSLKQVFPDATAKVCIFVHGLMCTEWSWHIGAWFRAVPHIMVTKKIYYGLNSCGMLPVWDPPTSECPLKKL